MDAFTNSEQLSKLGQENGKLRVKSPTSEMHNHVRLVFFLTKMIAALVFSL